jgi:hypothetical protein
MGGLTFGERTLRESNVLGNSIATQHTFSSRHSSYLREAHTRRHTLTYAPHFALRNVAVMSDMALTLILEAFHPTPMQDCTSVAMADSPLQ